MEATPTVEDVIRPLNLWFSDAISRAVADNQVHGGQSALPFALGGIRNFFQIIVVEATKQHKYTEEMRSVLESLQIELELEQRFSHGNTTALERSTRVLENRVKECERRFGEAVQETAIHADRVKMLETALTKANNKAVDQDIRIRTLEADLHSLLSLVRKHSQVTSIHSPRPTLVSPMADHNSSITKDDATTRSTYPKPSPLLERSGNVAMSNAPHETFDKSNSFDNADSTENRGPGILTGNQVHSRPFHQSSWNLGVDVFRPASKDAEVTEVIEPSLQLVSPETPRKKHTPRSSAVDPETALARMLEVAQKKGFRISPAQPSKTVTPALVEVKKEESENANDTQAAALTSLQIESGKAAIIDQSSMSLASPFPKESTTSIVETTRVIDPAWKNLASAEQPFSGPSQAFHDRWISGSAGRLATTQLSESSHSKSNVSHAPTETRVLGSELSPTTKFAVLSKEASKLPITVHQDLGSPRISGDIRIDQVAIKLSIDGKTLQIGHLKASTFTDAEITLRFLVNRSEVPIIEFAGRIFNTGPENPFMVREGRPLQYIQYKVLFEVGRAIERGSVNQGPVADPVFLPQMVANELADPNEIPEDLRYMSFRYNTNREFEGLESTHPFPSTAELASTNKALTKEARQFFKFFAGLRNVSSEEHREGQIQLWFLKSSGDDVINKNNKEIKSGVVGDVDDMLELIMDANAGQTRLTCLDALRV